MRLIPPAAMCLTIRSFCAKSSDRAGLLRLASGGTAKTPLSRSGETLEFMILSFEYYNSCNRVWWSVWQLNCKATRWIKMLEFKFDFRVSKQICSLQLFAKRRYI